MPKDRPRASQKTPKKPSSRQGHGLLWLGSILAITCAVYLPCLENEFTSWDDNGYVTENALVAHPNLVGLLTVPVCANYHPLTMASLALNYRISGLHPASYHWLNLLLHLANTALVFLFIRRLTGGRIWTTVVTSLLFGIHPMHVESVAWIAERKDVLYGFFYLLALVTYLRFLDMRGHVWLIATFLAFVCSAASKPAAVVLPLALLAIDFFRRRPIHLAVLLEKVPFFAVSIAGGLITIQAQGSAGAIVGAHVWSPFERLLFASYAVAMYGLKLFLPISLSVVYPYPDASGRPLSDFYVAFAALVILLSALLWFFRRNRVILFGLAFFFINIILVLQFLPVGSAIMAERYTYLSYIGLFFALSWWLDERRSPRMAGIPVKPVIAVALILLIPFSLLATWKRCEVWRSSETLENDIIRRYPHRIWYAYWHRAYDRMRRGRSEEALADFNEALALNSGVASVWMHKGALLADLNRNDSALVCSERAIALKPDYAEAVNNRGGIRVHKGDLAGGIADFDRAIALDPKFRDAFTNRASAYSMMHEYEKAIADRRRAIELDRTNPGNYRLHGSNGASLQQLNRPREAILEYDEAIRAAPPGDERLGPYYLKRSQAWWGLRERTQALNDAREAARRGAKVDSAYMRELGRP